MKLLHKSGVTRRQKPLKSPFVTVPLAGGVLDADQSVTITLTFIGTGGRPHYKARVLSGPGVR
jgi:hypothetical protein